MALGSKLSDEVKEQADVSQDEPSFLTIQITRIGADRNLSTVNGFSRLKAGNLGTTLEPRMHHMLNIIPTRTLRISELHSVRIILG